MPLETRQYPDLKVATPKKLREAIRTGFYEGHTAGLATGKLQCNLAILPEQYTLDFLRFCIRNPKPCPVVAIGDSGVPYLPTLGRDIDIRSDVSKYHIYQDGALSDEVTDISNIWSDNFVTVALGCSFTFENALIRNGIPVRHIETGKNVPMYRSNIELVPAGRFSGKMVVTMRPIPATLVNQACNISRQYPQAHGAPIAIGDPLDIGISDLNQPDWGEAVAIHPGDIPVYWACGVTPQNVLLDAKLPICITHSPGHMLVTDVPEDAETTILTNRKKREEE